MIKKTVLDYRYLVVLFLLLCGCLSAPLSATTLTLTAKKGGTPFLAFKALWEEQGNNVENFTLLTPVSETSIEAITPLLKKALKVKEEVDFGDTLTVGNILTTLQKALFIFQHQSVTAEEDEKHHTIGAIEGKEVERQ